MYAVARFNSWIGACGFRPANDMRNEKEKTVEYFVTQCRAMLKEDLVDYIKNFEAYMQTSNKRSNPLLPPTPEAAGRVSCWVPGGRGRRKS